MQRYFYAFLLALALHLTITSLFTVHMLFQETPKPKTEEPLPEIIQASILDETLVEQKAQALKQREENKLREQQKLEQQLEQEKLRLQQTKNKRLQEEKVAKQQAEALKQAALEEQRRLQEMQQKVALEKKKQKELEQKRLAEEKQRELDKQKRLEAERLAAEKRKQEQEKQEAVRKEAERLEKIAVEKRQREAQEQLRIAAEKQAQEERIRAENARIAAQATANAKALITQKVTRTWNQPSTVTDKLHCTIKVGLIASGDVMSVTVIRSSGNRLFDESAERAVWKASPLPVPKDPGVFAQFRSFIFEFAPN